MVRFSSQSKQSKRLRTSEEAMPVPSAPPDSGNSVTVTLDVDVLDCSVCMESMIPPIFQCSNGHVTCKTCHSKINNVCPTCSSPMGNIRNLQLEKLLETMFAPCKHAGNGCGYKSKFIHKSVHESSCEYRPSTCPIKPCNVIVPLRDVSHHLVEDHQVATYNIPWEYRYTLPVDSAGKHLLLRVDGINFLLHQEKEQLGNVVYLTYFDSPTQNDYWYEVEVKSGTGRKRLTFEGAAAHDVDQGLQRQAIDFFVIPMNMYPPEGHLQLDVTLRRVGGSSVKKKIMFSDSLF